MESNIGPNCDRRCAASPQCVIGRCLKYHPIGLKYERSSAVLLDAGADDDLALPSRDKQPQPRSAADILDGMAHTFRARNAVYGSNYKMVAPLVKVLFPDGVPPELVVTDKWHLFELALVKLSRLAISKIEHVDSVHDMGVYCAMVEACILEEQQ